MKQLLITIAAVVLVGCGEPSSELLQQSATDGNVEAVKQHLADGADVNVKDEARGLTPLHFATQNGQKEIVELLIADGADVNAKMNNGMTPLDCSALIPPSSNKTEIVDLLSKHGGEASGVFGQAIKESEVNLNKEVRGENYLLVDKLGEGQDQGKYHLTRLMKPSPSTT